MAEIKEFKGFYPETKKFFLDLKENNYKEWFHANKKDYEKFVREPSKEFVKAVMMRFADKGIPFMGDPKKSLFRVNRDIRFSKNKDPYKTNLGAYFVYTEAGEFRRSPEVPGMYFHFEPDMVFIGGGLHMPASEDLRKIRERISEEYKDLENILNDNNFTSAFDKWLTGDKLKRMPKGYPADHPAGDYLKMKEFSAVSDIDEKVVYSAELVDAFEEKCLAILPFIHFFTEAINE